MTEITIRPLDAAAVAIYLVAMLTIGHISARRSKSSENYFVGHRDFPGWLVALSMLGSIISSMTFLALPAAAFILDWRQFTVNMMMPLVAVLAVVLFIPFFRRGGLTSAFEYLGDRFGVVARLYGTVNFIGLQLIRLAQVLFLMALPMQFLTGVPLDWVIVGVGIFVALYTVAGGMETVVVADAVQAGIKVLGGALCLVWVLLELPGGFGQVLEVGQAHQKFSLGGFEWDLGQRTFWTLAILGIMKAFERRYSWMISPRSIPRYHWIRAAANPVRSLPARHTAPWPAPATLPGPSGSSARCVCSCAMKPPRLIPGISWCPKNRER